MFFVDKNWPVNACNIPTVNQVVGQWCELASFSAEDPYNAYIAFMSQCAALSSCTRNEFSCIQGSAIVCARVQDVMQPGHFRLRPRLDFVPLAKLDL